MSGNELAEPPDEIVEYLLCKEFGWTLTELYDQPGVKVLRFLQIMHIKRQHDKMKEQAQAT